MACACWSIRCCSIPAPRRSWPGTSVHDSTEPASFHEPRPTRFETQEQSMRYPPGISTADFDRAVDAFRAAIGDAWVFTDEADVDLYRDAYSPMWGEEEERIPSIAIAPASAEEVQAVMRICHQYGVPVYPVSTGKNLGYGGSAPVLNGSVVLDLKRMNRIIEVNEDNSSALAEPGVSYSALYTDI